MAVGNVAPVGGGGSQNLTGKSALTTPKPKAPSTPQTPLVGQGPLLPNQERVPGSYMGGTPEGASVAGTPAAMNAIGTIQGFMPQIGMAQGANSLAAQLAQGNSDFALRGNELQRQGLQNSFDQAQAGRGVDMGYLQQLLGFNQRDLGITNEDIASQRSYLGRGNELNGQDLALARQLLDLQTQQQFRQQYSDAVARGATVTQGNRDQYSDLLRGRDIGGRQLDVRGARNQLGYEQGLHGLDVQGQQGQLGFDKTKAGIEHQMRQSDIDKTFEDKNLKNGLAKLGLNDEQIKFTLQTALAQGDLDTVNAIQGIIGQAVSLAGQLPDYTFDYRVR
jgi:hypothetical protein